MGSMRNTRNFSIISSKMVLDLRTLDQHQGRYLATSPTGQIPRILERKMTSETKLSIRRKNHNSNLKAKRAECGPRHE